MYLPTQVIYTANAELTLLNFIFNGVVMVCKQTALIWGFAMMAATWRIVTMTAAATLRAANGPEAGSGLAQNSVSLLIPFLLATALTAPTLQTKVIIQSSMTGTNTVIDHVPVVISVVPATVSVLSQKVGEVIKTANSSASTDYSSLSAADHGFINPLKTLLTSRTAILKMGGLNSQINSVISACLGSDSGANYSSIASLVINAGNTGANASQSLPVFDLSGNAPTAVGALLYQASLNPNGFVNDIDVGGNHVVSCYDAALQVATNINSALYSAEFSRGVQGAVNSADQVNKSANYSIGSLSESYLAVRTANTVTNTLAGGTSQANAEMINLLFSELIKNDLDCLKADSTNKTTCLAMAVQSNEIERNNIQSAANGVETLLYAGQFSNYITALIIGLGPVIIMFMMLSGIEAVKNMKVAVHMLVWPLLIMNVGAELINGMIYNAVANFMSSISQGGYISQAVAVEVYKNFSLKVGTASHLMATLPILMTTIFALGQSAALVKISGSMGSKSKNESSAATPAAVNNAPLVNNGSIARAEQGVGFSKVALSGALDAVSTSSQYGSLANEAGKNVSTAITRQKMVSEGESNIHDWKKAFQTGDYSKWGLNRSEGESIRDSYEHNLKAAEAQKTARTVASQKSNDTNSNYSLGAGFTISRTGVAGSVGADVKTTANASDSLRAGQDTAKEKSLSESDALSNAISNEASKSSYSNTGGDKSKSLQASLATQRNYSKTLSSSESLTDTTNEAIKRSESFVQQSGKIGSTEIANQMATNGEYSRFQLSEGRSFDQVPAIQGYKDKAAADMASGASDRIISSGPAHDAAVRHRAAVMLANDPSAKPEDRLAADHYLVKSAQAMQAMTFTVGDTSMRKMDIAQPTDRTGVDAKGLVRSASSLEPKGSAVPAPFSLNPTQPTGETGKGSQHAPPATQGTTVIPAPSTASGPPSMPSPQTTVSSAPVAEVFAPASSTTAPSVSAAPTGTSPAPAPTAAPDGPAADTSATNSVPMAQVPAATVPAAKATPAAQVPAAPAPAAKPAVQAQAPAAAVPAAKPAAPAQAPAAAAPAAKATPPAQVPAAAAPAAKATPAAQAPAAAAPAAKATPPAQVPAAAAPAAKATPPAQVPAAAAPAAKATPPAQVPAAAAPAAKATPPAQVPAAAAPAAKATPPAQVPAAAAPAAKATPPAQVPAAAAPAAKATPPAQVPAGAAPAAKPAVPAQASAAAVPAAKTTPAAQVPAAAAPAAKPAAPAQAPAAMVPAAKATPAAQVPAAAAPAAKPAAPAQAPAATVPAAKATPAAQVPAAAAPAAKPAVPAQAPAATVPAAKATPAAQVPAAAAPAAKPAAPAQAPAATAPAAKPAAPAQAPAATAPAAKPAAPAQAPAATAPAAKPAAPAQAPAATAPAAKATPAAQVPAAAAPAAKRRKDGLSDDFEKRFEAGNHLRGMVNAGIIDTVTDVKKDVREAQRVAEASGLSGEKRNGTFIRAGKNVISNVVGDSRTELDLDKPTQPTPPKTKKAKVEPVAPQESKPDGSATPFKRYEAPTD